MPVEMTTKADIELTEEGLKVVGDMVAKTKMFFWPAMTISYEKDDNKVVIQVFEEWMPDAGLQRIELGLDEKLTTEMLEKMIVDCYEAVDPEHTKTLEYDIDNIMEHVQEAIDRVMSVNDEN